MGVGVGFLDVEWECIIRFPLSCIGSKDLSELSFNEFLLDGLCSISVYVLISLMF